MALAKRNYKKENKQPINKFIKAAKVRLISSSGEQMGIKSIDAVSYTHLRAHETN